MKLTDAQYDALGRTRKKEGVPVSGPCMQEDGTRRIPDGHLGPQTANVLIVAGLAMMIEGTLRVTKAGRRFLEAVRPEGPGTYLDRNPARPLTHSLVHAVSDEPEVMNVELLHPDWKLRAEAHRKLSRADLDTARLSGLMHPEERVAELRRVAAERGQDVASELKRVELTRKAHDRAVRSLERKVRTDEEAA